MLQRTQFEEFTSAWDQYMIDYEMAAYQSVERMKKEHAFEIDYLKQDFMSSPRRYKPSKKLVEFRSQEAKTFSAKNYDGATYYKQMAIKQEQQERMAHEEKMIAQFNSEE
jgi:hypothetical protein